MVIPLVANTRIIRGLHKTLNINDLCLTSILSSCEKHHIAPQYRLYRTAKWALSENKMSIFGLRYGVYEAVVRAEIASIRRDLTSIHTYFTKIFCQNYVKKNRKFVF